MEAKLEGEDSKEMSKVSPPQTLPETSPMPDFHPVPSTEEAPDPEEDDLDDLDDMLEEFSATTLNTTSKPPPSSIQEPKAPELPELSDDDFAKQLQAGMADLIGEFDKSPAMKAELEAMMKELNTTSIIDGTTSPSPSNSKPAAPTTATDESFQATIKKTMERMQASGDAATASAIKPDPEEEDFLAEMLKQMQGGEGSEEDFSKMLMGMMEQLTNKEILYEPMKELDEKFPAWFEKNRETTGKDDLERYLEQQRLVKEIVGKFEEKGYSDENVEMREYIVDRMQKMQAAGSPPEDLVGDMATAQEAFGVGAADEGCPTQ